MEIGASAKGLSRAGWVNDSGDSGGLAEDKQPPTEVKYREPQTVH